MSDAKNDIEKLIDILDLFKLKYVKCKHDNSINVEDDGNIIHFFFNDKNCFKEFCVGFDYDLDYDI